VNLRETRKARGLTQQQLAALSGVTRQTIAALETGRVRLNTDHLIPIMRALGEVDLADRLEELVQLVPRQAMQLC
jgi:transcriptional regulator with XRE-family HTH domain